MDRSETEKIVAAPSIGVAVLVATLSLNLLALALPIAMLQIFDRVVPFQSHNTLMLLFLGLCTVVTLEFTLKCARVVLLGAAAERFEVSQGAVFMDRTLRARSEEFRKNTVASYMDKFGAIGHLRGYYSGQGRILAIDLPFTIVFVLMIWLIGGWLVAVPLASIALMLVFRIVLRRAQAQIFDERKLLDNRRYSFLFEVLSQVSTIKCNTMEPQLSRRYEVLQRRTVKISEALIHFSGFSQSFGALFSQVAVAAMGLFGAYLVVEGRIGIAELAACMLLNGRTVQPLLTALNHWAQSESIAASNEKLTEVYDIRQRQRTQNLGEILEGRITFSRVTISNGQGGASALADFSKKIAPGQHVAVTGLAGDDGARLLRLVLGEVTPDDGRVYIDDRRPSTFINTQGPDGIAYVDHNPFRFPGTVLDNLSTYGDGAAIERALDNAKITRIEEVLHKLPLGYNTILNESAELVNNPSILQRINLARVLTLQPKILLLGDITGLMDMPARHAIADAIARIKGKTTVLYTGDDEVLLNVFDDVVRHGIEDDGLWGDMAPTGPAAGDITFLNDPKVA